MPNMVVQEHRYHVSLHVIPLHSVSARCLKGQCSCPGAVQQNQLVTERRHGAHTLHRTLRS